ncbi:helix-turn-helix transcriptional regulator [Dyadobacter chenwenxiniae]|uniref:Helix-turn-helix transcriptional regulator n=1 Tax=Dyadobacter chenwenxiniae TaxID=2906456 RepID=A0A9X1PPQ4_9BACT|nr:helix-turn-helix domain-containing protein [Dyadobacter chenwenxiniae]MCF0049142.1 helix-turn-helix transcriptional regulator [Dyadobacter chenwenxiniae]MCF0064651.1 helix-turn-helix transcriptional regulator [Dyadobacter chenwenxiniae]UON84295.1 helix-turn-helix transcriptional regulator [Dyadobacter chenwenxiniae]
MRKETSTNALNERMIIDSCGMAYTLGVLGGRWKPAILCRLMHGTLRYGELKKSILGISERMLVAQLRELESDGIVQRKVFPEVPPRVEYEMTELGLSMQEVLAAMSDWGNMHRSVSNDRALAASSEAH